MRISVAEIAKHLNGEIEGQESLELVGLAEIAEASSEHLCFAKSEDYLGALEASAAGAVIVAKAFPSLEGKTLIRVDDPGLGFIQAMELFALDTSFSGIHQTAVIAPSAQLGKDVGIGPHEVIEEGARIGSGVCIRAGAYIGENASIGDQSDVGSNVSILWACRIGKRCLLHPGVCIGSDGYGFRWLSDHHHKIPQQGIVVVGDDVEIGANTCIDRATMGATRIGTGTKIDNLVHIAHNNQIGEHVILAGQVGFAGSSKVGDRVMMAGQVGISDHVEIGAGTFIGGKAAVTRSLPADSNVWGIPARPLQDFKKQFAVQSRLPEMQRQLKQQQKQLEALEARLAELEDRSS